MVYCFLEKKKHVLFFFKNMFKKKHCSNLDLTLAKVAEVIFFLFYSLNLNFEFLCIFIAVVIAFYYASSSSEHAYFD